MYKPILSLGPADPSLEIDGKVTSSFAIVPELAKKIEAVGKVYAKL